MTLARPGEPRQPELHDAVAAPLAALDGAGVRWCLLRGAHELDRVDGDVDLLVSRSDLPGLRRALVALGGLLPLSSWGRQPHHFFVGPAGGDDEARLKLDVVSALAFGRFGELPTAAADPVLAGRRRAGEVWIPAPADAFWALLAHAVLDRGRIRAERGAELGGLAPGARGQDSALRDVIEAACPPGWDGDAIISAVEHGAWGELEALGPRLRERWPGTTAARRAATVALRRAQRKAQRLQQRGAMTSKRRARSTG